MNLSGAQWIYPHGYTLVDTGYTTPGFPSWRRRPVQEYTADELCPLTLFIEPDIYIRPDRHGYTDGLTVPGACQIIVPYNLSPQAAIIHDSACREHCLYLAHTFRGEYERRPVTWQNAARYLGMGVHADGYPKRACIIYRAVMLFGPRW